MVETEFDPTSAAATGEITLLLRAAERLGASEAEVIGVPVRVVLSLATGCCSPLGEDAERFVSNHSWFETAITEYTDWLTERVQRSVAQADRETSLRAALDGFEPGSMVPHDEIFPHDWDFLFRHDDRIYWAIDHHCLNPGCTCAEIVVQIHDAETRTPRHVGQVRIDLNTPAAKPVASSGLVRDVFASFWERNREELLRRHREIRNAVVRRARSRPLAPERPPSAVMRQAVGRNAPCTCGSGKKFKRCCAVRAPSAS